MRTSLNNIKAIDDYLLGNLNPGDKLLFDANMLLNNDLKDEIKHQQKTYTIVREYGRQKIKDEIIAVKQVLTTAPRHRGFMQRITDLFIKH